MHALNYCHYLLISFCLHFEIFFSRTVAIEYRSQIWSRIVRFKMVELFSFINFTSHEQMSTGLNSVLSSPYFLIRAFLREKHGKKLRKHVSRMNRILSLMDPFKVWYLMSVLALVVSILVTVNIAFWLISL